MVDVLVVGVAVVDFVFGMDSLPDRASKYRAKAAEIVGGGCGANAALAVVRLGGAARLGARLGNDPLGDLIVSDLVAEGVDAGLIRRTPGAQSSFSSVHVDAAGERQIVNFRGAGLTEDTNWLDGVEPTDAVLVDTRWPEAAALALKLARAWGVPGVLDGEPPIAPELVAAASHVALSRPGLESLSDIADPAKALEAVAAGLPGWACVTDGEHGVYYTGKAGIEHVPAFDVPVKDTLAAGDIWHGALSLALAEGQAEPQAIRFANAAAALKCMTFGGRAGCPDRATLEKFLKERA